MSAAASLLPAHGPRDGPLAERLLVVDRQRRALEDARLADLPARLRPGDVLVVNDAATLPASFRLARGDVELRLLQRLDRDSRWLALLFGAGDWRTPTEHREAPPRFVVGARLEIADDLVAHVERIDAAEPRLIELAFDSDGAELWSALYRHGRPIQYAYVDRPLELWDVQSRFAARPWALESPSAGRPLSWSLLTALRQQGVLLAHVTHAAGISSMGSDALDRRLPLPERYEVGDAAVSAIERARASGGRVVAVGTTVVRALESAARLHGGRLAPSAGEATILLGPGFRPAVVDALLTGLHEPGTSHFALLEAFAPRDLLEQALTHAAEHGYLGHEFGDTCLVLGARLGGATLSDRRPCGARP